MRRNGLHRAVGSWGPVLVWMGVIFLLSSQSSFPLRAEGFWELILSKLGHLAEYAVLGALLIRALSPGVSRWTAAAVWSVAVAVAYAVTDEIHQSLVPLRTPSAVDVAIDAVGALVGVGAWRVGTRLPASGPSSGLY